ncbi:S1 family peptidase [Streptomyces sp. NPDC057638]|uniref:S1 family peptidase n=1 Tax=Streptomyces sp. NPDC057638 TaxID=3346190 RepID=UPI003681ECCA
MRRTLRARILLTSLLALPAVTLAPAAAHAASGPDPVPAPGPGIAASAGHYAIQAKLDGILGGDDTAGSYLDPVTGELVVTVTDSNAADEVRASGARAELVQRSTTQLKSAMKVLENRAKIPGTSWGVDPSSNQVSVEADTSVDEREMARLRSVADGLGAAVRVARIPGVLKREVAGGDAIYGGGVRCSAAFNVAQGADRYFLTAGHCGNVSASWAASSGGAAIGTRQDSRFPTDDFALIRYTDGSNPPGTVDLYDGTYRDITSAANALVGQAIQKSGSTTRVTSGRVTAVNVTVNYSDGPVYGMVRTTACSAGGDSGGAHFAGGVALGIHSGSAGCSGTAGSAIHQPVLEPLSTYGVAVY